MSFTLLPDLALRTLGGSVMEACDESFAEKENLINPGAPAFQAHTFGLKGQEYDGWETRRRRSAGHDWVIVRLGLPGVIRGVVVDTAWFKGNYPPYASVEACAAEGYPAAGDLAGWTEIVPKSPLKGDTAHEFAVCLDRRCTHVRLNIFPDGGVARLRVHGDVVPDPRLLAGLTVDLAALANGATVTGCSDMFYSSPTNLIMPGLARHQAEGWETARRRDEGNDWVILRLAGPGVVRLAELDTGNLKFNAPGEARIRGADARAGSLENDDAWFDILPRTRLQPDTAHTFRVGSDRVATHARIDIYPDGGLARVRLHGSLTEDGEGELFTRWRTLS
jgi:allantoicase